MPYIVGDSFGAIFGSYYQIRSESSEKCPLNYFSPVDNFASHDQKDRYSTYLATLYYNLFHSLYDFIGQMQTIIWTRRSSNRLHVFARLTNGEKGWRLAYSQHQFPPRPKFTHGGEFTTRFTDAVMAEITFANWLHDTNSTFFIFCSILNFEIFRELTHNSVIKKMVHPEILDAALFWHFMAYDWASREDALCPTA